jgi:hypothetical protein
VGVILTVAGYGQPTDHKKRWSVLRVCQEPSAVEAVANPSDALEKLFAQRRPRLSALPRFSTNTVSNLIYAWPAEARRQIIVVVCQAVKPPKSLQDFNLPYPEKHESRIYRVGKYGFADGA